MNFKEKDYKIFDMFSRQWGVVTAGDITHYNGCTIAWGSLGTLWGRPVATVYVNPDRYTWDFLKESDTFTVSFFPEACREALNYMGSHSGRDEDKARAAGLHAKAVGNGTGFEEANLTFVCKKLFQGELSREGLADEINNGIYKNWEPHWMFVGEIVEAEDLR